MIESCCSAPPRVGFLEREVPRAADSVLSHGVIARDALPSKPSGCRAPRTSPTDKHFPYGTLFYNKARSAKTTEIFYAKNAIF